MRPHLLLLSCSAFLVCASCSTWDAPNDAKLLPAPRLAPDGVVLEVEFVRVPVARTEEAARFWVEVDEQQIPFDSRRRLDANGLRCGIVGLQLPVFLRELLDAERSAFDQLAQGDLVQDADIFSNYKRLQCRSGSRKRVPATPQLPGKTVIILNRDGQLSGEPFEEAQAVFSLATFPRGDGQVRVVLTPLIEHGDTQAKYVALPGLPGSIAMQAGREQTKFDELKIDAVLSPGQSLIVACTPQIRGLGGAIFAASAASQERSIMLLRLAQSQYDDLWSDDRAAMPLTTQIE